MTSFVELNHVLEDGWMLWGRQIGLLPRNAASRNCMGEQCSSGPDGMDGGAQMATGSPGPIWRKSL